MAFGPCVISVLSSSRSGLRPWAPGDPVLVIISPHNESIRAEFSRAFGAHMQETAGRRVRVDWRVPGGTSEIERYLDSGEWQGKAGSYAIQGRAAVLNVGTV